MKTLVLTGYDDAFKELGEITTPGKEEYARRHGFFFYCMKSYPLKGHPSWWKMHHIPNLFHCYDRVIWMDADIVVTNPEVVPPGESGYHVSRDWGQDSKEWYKLNNGCFCCFPDSVPIFRWVLDNREKYSQEFHEQNHLREYARHEDGGDGCQISVHPPRVFNSVPVEIHPSVVDPWRPGDWCAHLTMVALPERVRLAKEFIGRAK